MSEHSTHAPWQIPSFRAPNASSAIFSVDSIAYRRSVTLLSTPVVHLLYARCIPLALRYRYIHPLHGYLISHVCLQVHHLLLYVVLANAAAAAAEGVCRHRVMPALGRAFFVLLQGTWFFQVGFILYPPQGWPGHHWDLNSDRQVGRRCFRFTRQHSTFVRIC